MQHSNHQYKKKKIVRAFSGGLLGVLLLIVMPAGTMAFQSTSAIDKLVEVDSTGYQKFGPFSTIYSFDFADYDLDGDYDMLVFGQDTTDSSVRLRVLNNDGAGNFSTSSVSIGGFDQNDPTQMSVKWVDSNLDNKADIFFNGHQAPGSATKLYTNNGDGTFTNSNASFSSSYTKDSYLWMDFDNDGDEDLLLQGSVSELNNGFYSLVYLNDGFGNFSVPDSSLFIADYGTGFEYTKIYAPFDRIDYDMDRDYDLITNNSYQDVTIFENKGGLNFVDDTSLPFDDVFAEIIEVADVNSDGPVDIIISGLDGSNNQKTFLYFIDSDAGGNSYQSGMAKHTSFTFPGIDNGDIEVLDISNDGYMEIIMAGDSSGIPITRIFTNTYFSSGSATFSVARDTTNSHLTNIERAQISILDLDNDNDLDVFLAGENYVDNLYTQVFFLKNSTSTSIPAIDNNSVYNPSASIHNDSLRISNLPSYNSYTFYLYNQDESKYYQPPRGNTSTGFRTIPGRAQVEYYNINYNDTDLDLNQKFDRGYLPGGNYEIGIQAYDNRSGAGTAFKSSTFKVTPMAPREVTLTADSVNKSVTLTWRQNPGTNTDKYFVYQTKDSLLTASAYDLNTYDYNAITLGETTDTTFTVSNLGVDTTYNYFVAAFTNDVSLTPQYSELSNVDSVRFNAPPLLTLLSDALTGVSFGATTWGDYDNDGDLDLVVAGSTNGGNSGAIAELYDNDGSGNFTKNNTVSSSLVGMYRAGAAFGDYDNDGYPDLVILGYNSSGSASTILYKNNTNGTFSQVSNTGFADGAWASAYWGDANNDGYLDLYLSGLPNGPGRFSNIYLNDKDGTFTLANTGILGTAGGDFTFVDYDNDGDLDVATSGYTDASSNQVKFYENDNGSYVEVSAISLQLYANDHATMDWGDFNGDGYMDLFNTGNGAAQLLVNNGNGGFTVSSQTFTGVYQGAADWKDYDLDGDLDLIYIGENSGSKSFLYDNNGDGTFTLNTSFNLTGASYGSVDWVDVDNDGDPDLLISGYLGSGRTTSIYKNNSTSVNNSPTTPVLNTPTFANNAVTLSWNPTTDSEGGKVSYNAFLYNITDSEMFVESQSDSSSGFRKVTDLGNMRRDTSRSFTVTEGSYSWGVQAIDASGKPSVFAKQTFFYDLPESPTNLQVSGVITDATLTWDPSSDPDFQTFKVYQRTSPGGDPVSVQSLTDTTVSFSNLERGITYYFQISQINTLDFESPLSAAVTYTTPEQFQIDNTLSISGVRFSDSDWGDYDNDGDLDLVLIGTTNGNNGGAIAEIYDNDGNGGLTLNLIVSNILGGVYRGGVSFGDYDKDGYLDLVIAGYNTSNNPSTRLYKNNGAGSFVEITNTGFTNVGYGATNWMDYDNDGDLDLMLAGLPGNSHRINDIFRNNGDGTFTNSNAGLPGTADGNFVFADFDNDGDQDVAFSGYSNNNGPAASFYVNNNGVFVENTTIGGLLIASQGTTMEWGDYDNDGDLDLFNAGGGTSKLIRNNGNGTMTDSGISFGALSWTSSAWGDYDNDGDLDLIVNGHDGSSQVTKVIENNGNSTFSTDTSITLTGLSEGMIHWVDLDNDGDLDVFAHGGDENVTLRSQVYVNETDFGGSAPSIPANLWVAYNIGKVEFSWDASTDSDGGPVSYNVFINDTLTNSWVLVAQADSATGFRRSLGLGNAELRTQKTISLPNGTYQFGVQAIDGTGRASDFSTITETLELHDAPTWISADKVGDDIALSWNPHPDNDIDFYKIYRNSRTEPLIIYQDSTSGTSYTVLGLSYENYYSFYITAVDTSGSESAYSEASEVEFRYILSEVEGFSATPGWLGDVEWGDFDSDGDLDLIVAGVTTNPAQFHTSLYRNDGNDTFNYIGNVFTPRGYENVDVSFIDFNNDGRLDVLANGQTDSRLYIKDQANWYSASNIFLMDSPESIVVGDVNGDGYDEVIMTGYPNTQSTTKLYLNNADDSGFSTDTVNTFIGVSNSNLALGDFDNDGDLDLALTGRNYNTNTNYSKIYTNDGKGVFTDSGISITAFNLSHVEWGDFNNDGFLDLLISGTTSTDDESYSNARTEIYENDGNGGLTYHSSLYGIMDGTSIWGDYDNDGFLDVFLAGRGTSGAIVSKLFKNEGDETFTEITDLAITEAMNSASAWGDYDNDGDLDLVVSGTNTTRLEGRRGETWGSKIKLYKNTSIDKGNAPTAPSNLQVSIAVDTAYFQWDPSTDADGGTLTYNVGFLEEDTDNYQTNPYGDTETGVRKIVGRGNNHSKTSFKQSLAGLTNAYYTFGVQAIDQANRTSDYSTFRVPIGRFLTVENTKLYVNTDSAIVIPRNLFQINSFFKDTVFTLRSSGTYSGSLFMDENHNGMHEGSEHNLRDNAVSFSALNQDSLRYYQTDSEIKTMEFIMESATLTDSVELDIYSVESAPSLSGTANQGGWYLLSNPLNTTVGTLFENVWTQGAIGADTQSGSPNLYTFNSDSAKYLPIITDLDTTKVSNGQGILAYIFPDNNYDDAIEPQNGGWPKSLSNYGNPFAEQVTVSVRNTDVDGNGFTSGSEGFMLMGNPYGFALNVDSVVAELLKLDPYANRYVYRWDPLEKQYNLRLGGEIDPYESFFIRTIQSGVDGSTSFNYDDLHESVRSKSVIRTSNIDFELIADGSSSGKYEIALSDDASYEIDPFDGYYLGTYASRYANLYSTIGDQPLVLNNLPLSLTEEIEIPLFLHTSESGEHRLEWTINDLPEGWTVEIENPATGELISLGSQSSYTFDFTPQKTKSSKKRPNSPDLFGFMKERGVGKAKGSVNRADLVLRINPGLATNSESDLGIPREVELYQNYPNPFNPSSVIRFGVPNQAPVQLEVFDVLGRKVMTLLNGEVKQPGRYNINFDGRTLASGMYVYRLVIGDKVLTKKMTLIK